jgi:hypothetical protein
MASGEPLSVLCNNEQLGGKMSRNVRVRNGLKTRRIMDYIPNIVELEMKDATAMSREVTSELLSTS